MRRENFYEAFSPCYRSAKLTVVTGESNAVKLIRMYQSLRPSNNTHCVSLRTLHWARQSSVWGFHRAKRTQSHERWRANWVIRRILSLSARKTIEKWTTERPDELIISRGVLLPHTFRQALGRSEVQQCRAAGKCAAIQIRCIINDQRAEVSRPKRHWAMQNCVAKWCQWETHWSSTKQNLMRAVQTFFYQILHQTLFTRLSKRLSTAAFKWE